MAFIRYGPYSQADGTITVNLGFEKNYNWHEITVSIFDANDNPVLTGITGTLAGSTKKQGADQQEDFTETLDLANNERAWSPESSIAETFSFTPTGFNANLFYYVTINSWGF